MSGFTIIAARPAGMYYLVEPEDEMFSDEAWESLWNRFPGAMIRNDCSGWREFARVFVPPAGGWPGPAWSVLPPESAPPPRSAHERLQLGEPHEVLWTRDGLSEIRFVSDGYCYVVDGEAAK